MTNPIYQIREQLEKLRAEKNQQAMDIAMRFGSIEERQKKLHSAHAIDVVLQFVNWLIELMRKKSEGI
jgi:hypothetical protein